MTFPLIGLIGFAIALLSHSQVVPVIVGFAVVGAFMLASYRHKIGQSSLAGATSEMTGLATYLIGALVQFDYFWVATTLAVVSLLLLELKAALETLARKTAPGEILTFAKFLLLTAVILPVLPDQGYGPFQLNPFRTWLVVVAVSAVSYGSYVLQKATEHRGGIVLAAILGGAYSSTVTTVVLARRARVEQRPHLFAGGMLIASGVMFLRIIALLALFNGSLVAMLGPSFAGLALAAGAGGFVLTRLPDARSGDVERRYMSKNPLELGAALLFGAVFVAVLVATQLAVQSPWARGRLRTCGDHGCRGRGSVHHGHDAHGGEPDGACACGQRYRHRRREQQCREGDLRVRVRRPANRHRGSARAHRARGLHSHPARAHGGVERASAPPSRPVFRPGRGRSCQPPVQPRRDERHRGGHLR